MNKQRRTWFPAFLVMGGFILMLAAGIFPRQAEAVVAIECEILIEDGDVLFPGQTEVPAVGTNIEEDGEGVEGADPVVAWPGDGDPMIVYIDPISGASGIQVTIYGYNFTGVTSVTLTSGTATVVVSPDSVDPNVDDAGAPLGYGTIVFTTPAPPVPTGGWTDVTVTNTTGGTGTLPGGFFYIIPSPFPGLPGSSSVRWVEVVVSTNILDDFQLLLDGLPFELTHEELLQLFRDYLDNVFSSVTLWVDGFSDDEEENGFFSEDDRPLTPLLDLNDDRAIDDSENLAAEVYENFIPGSRARVFSFARNAGLGAMLRSAVIYSNANGDPPVTPSDFLLPYAVGDDDETMDQIVYRFACAWPSHDAVQSTGSGSGFVDIGSGFEIPRIAWPPENPALEVTGRVGTHVSNQYIGGSGDGDDDSELFIGNDYFVTVAPGCDYPASAVVNFRVLPSPPDAQFPGIQSDPPPPADAAFEGCEIDGSIGSQGPNYVLGVDPVLPRTTIGSNLPPGFLTRIRPDVEGSPRESYDPWEVFPRIIQMEYPTAVLAIHAHGGDPSEQDTAIFMDRITVTFTDIGGGAQFGRSLLFPGNGDFNPFFGLDNTLTRPPGYRGVDVYRDSDNDGLLDPESDIVYYSIPVTTDIAQTAWNPYFFVQDPGKGVEPFLRDDPEWTIVLDLATNRSLGNTPRTPYDPQRYDAMDDDNFADFALEAPPDAGDADNWLPDFFVAVQLDSGYTDTPGGRWAGDGTGIAFGADFRAYIKPELYTNPLDPLNQIAGGEFPGGIVFSGSPCKLMDTTMDEFFSPPYSAVMQTHDYVIHVESNNEFSSGIPWETVPFFMAQDNPGLGGPRSTFFPTPPPVPGGTTSWLGVTGQVPGFTLWEEKNFFEDDVGHRVLAQRIDSQSPPTCVVGLNLVNTPDEETLTFNAMKVAQIECYIVSEDHRGITGFQPKDLLPVTDDGLGDTGISLYLDSTADAGIAEDFRHVSGHSSGHFDVLQDTQIPLMRAEIDTVPTPIDMDGIRQDRLPLPDGDGVEDVDLWGYRVVLQPVNAIELPLDDVDANEGDDLYIVIQTSNSISYKDKIEVVIPHRGVTFHPTGRSAASGTLRKSDRHLYRWGGVYTDPEEPNDLGIPAYMTWPMPIEYGDALGGLSILGILGDPWRDFDHTQILTNVPTEINSLVTLNTDSDGDGVADAQGIGPLEQIPVIGLDAATLNEAAEVYLEYLVVEFYNQGDENFSPDIDLLPFMATDEMAFESLGVPRNMGTVTVARWHVGEGNYMLVGEPLVDLETSEVDPVTLDPIIVTLNAPFTGLLADIVAGVGDTAISGERLAWLAHVGSGIALYRDNDNHPNNRNGKFDPPRIATDPNGLPYFNYIDVPILLDDPPDLVGVAGEPPIQVRMAFSSPGTDNWEGTVDPLNAPTFTPLEEQVAEWAAYEDGRFGRQLVRTTFGRRENGNFIQGHRDAGDDFFVVIRTSESIQENDNFSAGIVSWGPNTPTGVDPDTFTAPPSPWQPSDEYEKFDEQPYASRAVGYIEILSDNTLPEPRAYTNLGGFDFLRTRATVQVETDMLYTTTETIPDAPPSGGGGGFGGMPAIGGGSGGGGGCLIATAAYGTRYEEHVVALVKFRDRYLLTNAGGTWLVKRYYSLSPRVAAFIARHEIMRTVVRQILRPAAAIARLCLMTSAAGKIAILFGSALVLAALMTARRKWRSVRVRV